MSKVIVDISMSLDGFVTGPGVDLEHGLGVGGEVIHDWVMGERTDADTAVLDDAVAATGAVVMGRRLFDIVDGPRGWGDEMGYGADRGPSNPLPYFVVTHRTPATMRLSGDFTFVTTGGIAEAVERAGAAAGDKDVMVMGGASVCDQAVAAGLVDRLHIHLAPVLLGSGTRLFDRLGTGAVHLEIDKVIETPRATHLHYRVG